MKEKFIDWKFSGKSLAMIERVNGILEDYRAQGYRLSLRQLYCQLVARDIIENSLRSYKNVGSLVSKARQAGLVDWMMLEDRNRDYAISSHWSSPASILESAAYSFRIDKWLDQPYHIEVMVEKDALSGVLNPVCRRLDIGITANKGYSSSSTMYEAGKRLLDQWEDDKKIVILYLGDHDPSGIDMTRDVEERLGLYSSLGGRVEIERLALNWDQVELWNPPPNPAKETDSRFAAYMVQFGETSWELDAIEPSELGRIVEEAVLSWRDEDRWEAAVEREEKMRADLRKMAESYGKNGKEG
jgi:hypothetical protein